MPESCGKTRPSRPNTVRAGAAERVFPQDSGMGAGQSPPMRGDRSRTIRAYPWKSVSNCLSALNRYRNYVAVYSLKGRFLTGDTPNSITLPGVGGGLRAAARRFLVYYEFARAAFLKILAYRLRYFTGIITYFLNVSVYYFIWSAIYSSSGSVAGYDLSQMVTYVSVGWIIRSFYFNNVDREMATEVLEGKISQNLIKPVDTQLMYIAQTVGEACFRSLLFTLPITLVLLLIYPIRPPHSVSAGILFVLSSALALVIFALVNFVVGTMALHIYSIVGVIRAKYFVVEFFSGLLIPLTFFPRALQRALYFLPFPYISFVPLQIYLGKEQGRGAWQLLGLQLVWAAALFVTGRAWWKFGTRRLSIQGG